MTDKDDDLMESVTRMADRLKLKGRERSAYVHEHMTRSGYRAVPQYVKDDGDDDDDRGSGFFGSKRSRNDDDDDDRPRSRSRSRSRRSDADDDWYS